MISHSRLGHRIFWALITLPVLLWLAGVGFSAPFGNPSQFVSSLGKAAAFSGLAAYCLMPVLSMRHKIIERIFGGLDTAYELHARTGKTSAFLILAHPLLLAGGAAIGGTSFLNAWDWSSPLIISGLVALISVLVLSGLAVYARIKHQTWIIIHRLLGWMIPVIFAHALLARGQMAQNKALFYYLLVLGIVGLSAFFYRSVLAKYLVKKYLYVVAEANHLTPLITELVLKPVGQRISYQPGQFAFVSIESGAMDKEFHPFSFSTADNGPYVRFTIKQLGDDTTNIKLVNPGTPVNLEGPYGVFAQHTGVSNNQVWIAGGVGIVPFLSMARSLTKDSQKRIKLYYAAEKLEDAVFLRELLSIQKTIPEIFEVTIVSQNTSGFVTIDMLQHDLPKLAEYYFLVCGPPPMMKTLKSGLMQNGIKSWQIITEEFSVR